ncbi:hypothetical protein ACB094_10G143400 [Castanea mollissima]
MLTIKKTRKNGPKADEPLQTNIESNVKFWVSYNQALSMSPPMSVLISNTLTSMIAFNHSWHVKDEQINHPSAIFHYMITLLVSTKKKKKKGRIAYLYFGFDDKN